MSREASGGGGTSPGAEAATRAEAVVADGADDHHLAGRVLQQPADVVGGQTLAAPRSGRHDDAVEALVCDRLS